MEIEGPTREYIRTLDIVPYARVYFAMPQHDQPELPLIAFSLSAPVIADDFIWRAPMLVDLWDVNKHDAAVKATAIGLAFSQYWQFAPFVGAGGSQLDHISDVSWLHVPTTTKDGRYQIEAVFYWHAPM